MYVVSIHVLLPFVIVRTTPNLGDMFHWMMMTMMMEASCKVIMRNVRLCFVWCSHQLKLEAICLKVRECGSLSSVLMNRISWMQYATPGDQWPAGIPCKTAPLASDKGQGLGDTDVKTTVDIYNYDFCGFKDPCVCAFVEKGFVYSSTGNWRHVCERSNFSIIWTDDYLSSWRQEIFLVLLCVLSWTSRRRPADRYILCVNKTPVLKTQ